MGYVRTLAESLGATVLRLLACGGVIIQRANALMFPFEVQSSRVQWESLGQVSGTERRDVAA